MNSKEDQTNSELNKSENQSFKEDQTNSELNKSQNQSSKINQKESGYNNEQSSEIQINEKSIDIEDKYKFGWSNYSEITNGRFAMIGFLAIILIELLSKQSFLKWAGIL